MKTIQILNWSVPNNDIEHRPTIFIANKEDTIQYFVGPVPVRQDLSIAICAEADEELFIRIRCIYNTRTIELYPDPEGDHVTVTLPDEWCNFGNIPTPKEVINENEIFWKRWKKTFDL